MNVKTVLFCTALIICASNRTMEQTREPNPMFEAILNEDPLALKRVLVERNPNFVTMYQKTPHTPLSLACSKGYKDLINQLLAAGAGPDFQVFDEKSKPVNETALTHAARVGNSLICCLLVKHGANVNPRNPKNYTPLHAAARSGKISIIKLLLGYNAAVNVQDWNGSTPLHEIIPLITEREKSSTRYQACLKLIKEKPEINIQTIFRTQPYFIDEKNQRESQIHFEELRDETPLMRAVKNRQPLYIILLKLNGADPFIPDRNGDIAADASIFKRYFPHEIEPE